MQIKTLLLLYQTTKINKIRKIFFQQQKIKQNTKNAIRTMHHLFLKQHLSNQKIFPLQQKITTKITTVFLLQDPLPTKN